MSWKEVRAPKGELNNLDHKFSWWLQHGMATVTPFPGPPGMVRFIMLELLGEECGDEDLVYGTLDEDDGDSTEHCMQCIPALEGPLEKGHEVLKCGEATAPGVVGVGAGETRVQPCGTAVRRAQCTVSARGTSMDSTTQQYMQVTNGRTRGRQCQGCNTVFNQYVTCMTECAVLTVVQTRCVQKTLGARHGVCHRRLAAVACTCHCHRHPPMYAAS